MVSEVAGAAAFSARKLQSTVLGRLVFTWWTTLPLGRLNKAKSVFLDPKRKGETIRIIATTQKLHTWAICSELTKRALEKCSVKPSVIEIERELLAPERCRLARIDQRFLLQGTV